MVEYVCKKCGRVFQQNSNLKRHENKKTPCVSELKLKSLKDKTLAKMSDQFTFIDLFCGIGGFHQALRKRGGKCVLACDIDEACRDNYFDNYGVRPEKNIRQIKENEVPDHDILTAGFPCQTFSNAGKKKCMTDERGTLFNEIIRIAGHKKPKFMILENVSHIRKVDNGNVFKYILQKLDETGYYCKEDTVFNLSQHQFGIPQQRERVFFVCIRKDLYTENPVVSIPENPVINLESILETDIDEKYYAQGDILTALTAWEEMIQEFEVNEKISPTIMVNEFYKEYSEDEFNSLAGWRKDYITKNRPLYEKYQIYFDSWYEENKDILSRREIYAKLEWQVGKIKENDSIWNYFIQLRQSGIRVKKAIYFPTLVAMAQIPIYGKEKRHITPRECARLQSFPEDYKIHPNDKKSYKQFGNSVNVHCVGVALDSIIGKYSASLLSSAATQ